MNDGRKNGDQWRLRPDGKTSQFCSIFCMNFEQQCSWIQVRPLDTEHRLC